MTRWCDDDKIYYHETVDKRRHQSATVGGGQGGQWRAVESSYLHCTVVPDISRGHRIDTRPACPLCGRDERYRQSRRC